MKEITEAEFDQLVIDHKGDVLVCWSALWCAPCQALKPTLERFAEEQGDKLTVFKIDVDDAPNLCKEYSVRSIPKLILFRDGSEVREHVGSASKETLLKLIS